MNAIRYIGLGAAGQPPEAPDGFQYPSLEQYASSAVVALGDIDDKWAIDHMSPPVAAAVMATRNVISGSVGASFADLVSISQSGQMSYAKGAQIAGAVGSLLDGTLELITQTAENTKALESVASAVPVLGAIVGWAVDIAVGVLKGLASFESAKGEVERVLHEQLSAKCQGLWAAHRPFPTGPEGSVSPADFFRRLAFSFQSWESLGRKEGQARWPMNASSMYLMLCGGESQGFGLSRARYKELLDKHRPRNPKIGIDPSIQRRMWRLIQGIFATVQPPIFEHPIADEGRALMPSLIEIVRMQYLAGHWDDTFARELSDQVTRKYKHSIMYQPSGAAGKIERHSSCAGQQHGVGRHIDLSGGLIASVTAFQAEVMAQFWDAAKQEWRVTPRNRVVAAPSGILELSPAQVQKTLTDVRLATTKGSLVSVLLTAAMAAGAGYGAFWLAKRSKISL